MSLRRLAMLEPVYRLAPDLLKSGRVTLPAGESVSTREARMTDFRLLRHGGFYHAVARYGEDLWTPFTYAGIHATERVLRRKEQHRFWGVDCYSSEEGRYLRIGNRTFYEDPDQEVEPRAWCVAADAWARELARNSLERTFRSFLSPDLLILDDLDLHRLTAQQSADLYELIIGRHRVSSFVITSNRAVGGKAQLLRRPYTGQQRAGPSGQCQLPDRHRGPQLQRETVTPPQTAWRDRR